MSDEVGGQPHAQLVTLFRHMDVHVCTDDIDSLQYAMQVRIARVYKWKDINKLDKTRTPSSSLIIASI